MAKKTGILLLRSLLLEGDALRFGTIFAICAVTGMAGGMSGGALDEINKACV